MMVKDESFVYETRMMNGSGAVMFISSYYIEESDYDIVSNCSFKSSKRIIDKSKSSPLFSGFTKSEKYD